MPSTFGENRQYCGCKGHLYYLFSTEGMPVVCHIHRSTDLGETWTECGRYEISDFDSEMIPMEYLVIDSLTQYTFTTMTDAGDYWWSYAKLTVDGGQTWNTITDSGERRGDHCLYRKQGGGTACYD